MVSVPERSLGPDVPRRHTTAQGIAALSIGGMIVARTMADLGVADELRAACMSVALDLGGWSRKNKSKAIRSMRAKSRRKSAL
jgi:TetR/AcrR family transcriptional regulator, transcriptional repressor for nem operon